MMNNTMLPEDLQEALRQHGITRYDEIALREALEQHAATYTLFKLADWPARRWKCRYRLMMGVGVYDAQNVPEAYARGLLALLNKPTNEQGGDT